ncbi:MAG: hypothetical protein WDW38_001940 [Sanguina aurantia]
MDDPPNPNQNGSGPCNPSSKGEALQSNEQQLQPVTQDLIGTGDVQAGAIVLVMLVLSLLGAAMTHCECL